MGRVARARTSHQRYKLFHDGPKDNVLSSVLGGLDMVDGGRESITLTIVVARCVLALISILQLVLILLFFLHGFYTDGWNGAGAVAVTVVVSRSLLDIVHCGQSN